jgi:hypothetical protein
MGRRSIIVLLLLVLTAACLPGGADAQTGVESNVEKRVIHGKTVRSERDEQESLFNYYFRDRKLKYETKFSELKTAAVVPGWRIPYSGDIHPQVTGGMSDLGSGGRRGRSAAASGASPLSLYDRAFNKGEDLANAYEVRRLLGGDSAIFPRLRMRRNSEGWEGYCSGLTAAAIRHPEPIHAVDAATVGGAAGVVFQPADIKALLTCIYNRTTDDSYLYLAPPSARDGGPNMGTFHLALANYVGRANHPIGIDRTKGQAAWNNPIYSYEVVSVGDAGSADHVHYKTLETNVTYSFYSPDAGSQTDPASGEVRGNQKQTMVLRYTLGLDDKGRIVGGTALSDSGYFLWLPLYAVQGKADGSAPGNPHLDVRKVIALARAAADCDTQKKFDQATIGPAAESSADSSKP